MLTGLQAVVVLVVSLGGVLGGLAVARVLLVAVGVVAVGEPEVAHHQRRAAAWERAREWREQGLQSSVAVPLSLRAGCLRCR